MSLALEGCVVAEPVGVVEYSDTHLLGFELPQDPPPLTEPQRAEQLDRVVQEVQDIADGNAVQPPPPPANFIVGEAGRYTIPMKVKMYIYPSSATGGTVTVINEMSWTEATTGGIYAKVNTASNIWTENGNHKTTWIKLNRAWESTGGATCRNCGTDTEWQIEYPYTNVTNSTTATCYAEYDYGTGAIVTVRHRGVYDPQSGWIVMDDPKSQAERHKNRLREIIEGRQAPMVITSRNKSIAPTPDIREQRARETLRRVLGEDKFRNFVRNGFVTVRGKSGLAYQIFPGHGITAVYDKGKMVERLCVVLAGDFPPTDSLIMRYIMILNNENQFRGFAVKHSVIERKPEQVVDKRSKPLTEIYKDIKAGKNPFVQPVAAVRPQLAKVG